jgi:hypothetical protein
MTCNYNLQEDDEALKQGVLEHSKGDCLRKGYKVDGAVLKLVQSYIFPGRVSRGFSELRERYNLFQVTRDPMKLYPHRYDTKARSDVDFMTGKL